MSTSENDQNRYDSVTAYLTADHAHIDGACATIGAQAAAGDFDAAHRSLRSFGAALHRHLQLEEEVVFPLFLERTHIVGPITVMRHEHRELEQSVLAVEAAIDSRQGAATKSALARLEQILATHNIKEERILYPKTDEALAPEERAALAQRLAAR